MIPRGTTVIVWAAALTLGCGQTVVHRWMLAAPQRPTNAPVRVFSSRGATPPSHEIALIEAVGTGNQAEGDLVLNALQREAMSLGCNGVVRVELAQGESTVVATGVAVQLGDQSTQQRVSSHSNNQSAWPLPEPVAAQRPGTVSTAPAPWAAPTDGGVTDGGVADGGVQ